MLTPDDLEKDLTWWGFNPHFGWSKFPEAAFMELDINSLRTAKFCVGLITSIGGGHRKRRKRTVCTKVVDNNCLSHPLDTWSSNVHEYKFPRIGHIFQRGKRGIDDHCCVWISACMLVNLDDQTLAKTMMEFMCKKGINMGWLHLFAPKDHCDRRSLSIYLNKYHFGYQLKRAKTQNTFVEHIMNAKSTGKYVCLLCDGNYSTTHEIGVDCDVYPKLIWDCCEDSALELSEANLDRCCGPGTYLKSISFMGELKRYGVAKIGKKQS